MLRIRARHLEAIEDGRFSDLPGSAYAVGFVRAYADHLGLHSEEVVRRFKQDMGVQVKPSRVDLSFPEPLAEGGVPRGAVLFVGAVIALVAYGGWYLSSVDNAFYKQWIEPIPERLATLLPDETVTAEPPISGEIQYQEGPASTAAEPADNLPAGTSLSAGAPTTAAAPKPEAPVEETPALATGEVVNPAPEPGGAEDRVTSDRAEAASEPAASVANSVAPAAPEPAPEAQTPISTPAPTPPEIDTARASDAAPAVTPKPSEVRQESLTSEAAAGLEQDGAFGEQQTGRDAADPVASIDGLASEADAEAVSEPTTQEAAVDPVPVEPVASTTRVKLKIISDSWVKIYDHETGDRFIEKLLTEGTELDVPDRAGLVLDTGNAGGLELYVDGEAVAPVGDNGDVVRAVPITAEALKAR